MKNQKSKIKNQKTKGLPLTFLDKKGEGFTLIEVLVGTALMLIIFIGIFGAYQLSLKVIGQSKARVVAVAIGNQQIEQIRNISYEELGTYVCKDEYPNCDPASAEEIIPGYPQGNIKEIATTSKSNMEYIVTTRIDYIDDEKDGLGASDNALGCPDGYRKCVNDYKKVNIEVSWIGRFGGNIFFDSIIAPKDCYQECGEQGGILKVSVAHEDGDSVEFVHIEVDNINPSSSYFGLHKDADPDDGDHYFLLPPDVDSYKVKVSKTGHSFDQTYGPGDVYQSQVIDTPAKSHPTVLENEIWPISFKIDKLSVFSIKTFEAKAENIYYVRKSGDNDNDGLSPDTAFLTIQKAASILSAGDMVFVGAGDYEEEVVPQNSGVTGDKIIYVADDLGIYTGDSGDVRIFAAPGQGFGFNIEDKQYIKIYGFYITNTTSAGIIVKDSGSNNIELINNIIYSNLGDGIYIENSSNIIISHNTLYSNGGDGIKIFDGSSSLDISDNRSYFNQESGIVLEKSVSNNNDIISNLVYANQKSGIILSDDCLNNNISNNTFFQNSEQGVLIELNSHFNEIKDNIITNNIITGIKVASGSSTTTNSYNNIWQNSLNYDGISADPTEICQDPLFNDSINGDFHISQVGPCVDIGSGTAVNLSMNDKTTSADNTVDSGIVDMGFHYSIDSSLPSSPDPFGSEIPNTEFHLLLEEQAGLPAIVGTNVSGNIYKYSEDHQTDGNGFLEISNSEFGSYIFSNFKSLGQDLNLIISWPSPMSVYLAPDITQEIKLGLRAENTLLTTIQDADTNNPLFPSEVRLFNAGYDASKVTNLNGEAYFIPLEQNWYNLEVSAEGYASSTTNFFINGHTEKIIQLTSE